MEILLKGLLHAALTHQSVHGISLILVFVPVLRKNAVHPTQYVGGIGGVIHPLRGGAGGNAGIVPVHHLADDPHGDILGKYIAVRHGDTVTHPGDETGLGIGEFVGNAINRAQRIHQLTAADGQSDGVSPGIGNILILQPIDEGLPGRVGGEGEGGIGGQRQRIDPLDFFLSAQINEPPRGTVAGVLITAEAAVGEFEGIAQAVGHQHLAVAVGDDAPAGLHYLPFGGARHGLGSVAVAVDNLIVEHYHSEKHQHSSQKTQQDNEPAAVGIGFFQDGIASFPKGVRNTHY